MQSLLDGQNREFAGLFLLVAAAAAIGEFAWRRYFSSRGYDGKATLATFGVAAGQLVSNGLSGIAIGAIYLAVYTATPFRQPLDAWWSWGLLFLLVEFCYYWQHRMSHEVRWLWATHSVHHSPNELTLPAASRLGWTGLISGLWVFFLPLVAMGFNPAAIALLITLNLRFQYFLHTELVGRLGPLEWIFNTPSAHRVHHASNPAYIDRNYGGVLIVFDRLFGTYAPERPEEACRYGLVTPQTSNNPLVIVTAEWRNLLGDMVRSGSPWTALKIAAGYPGARPVIIPPAARPVSA
jgi:sterol desaturase/sphingolipid hydroxylase (fatty acid hydroxylase superfamily)